MQDNNRIPTLHATTHKRGGVDVILLDELGVPTDVTLLNATATYHGLLPKLEDVTNKFLNAKGLWAVPPGGGGGGGTGDWSYNGNTVGSVKSIGTLDTYDFPFICGNKEGMRLNKVGGAVGGTYEVNLLIGTNTTQTLDPGEDFKYIVQIQRDHNQSTYVTLRNVGVGFHSTAGFIAVSETATIYMGAFGSASDFSDMRDFNDTYILAQDCASLLIYTTQNIAIRFGIADNEVARFDDTTGALLLGLTSPVGTEKLNVAGSSIFGNISTTGFTSTDSEFSVTPSGNFVVTKANFHIDSSGNLYTSGSSSAYIASNLFVAVSGSANMIIDSGTNRDVELKRNGVAAIDLNSGNVTFHSHLYASAVGDTIACNHFEILSTGADLTIDAASKAIVFSTGGGIVVDSPTGGGKGTGTINVSGDIYKNNTAYTNPDYALEHWATGKIEKYAKNPGADKYMGRMSLEELELHCRSYFRLPGISDEAMGAFDRSDFILEKIEEIFTHLFDLRKQICPR